MGQSHTHDHEHDGYQTPPEDTALRVKALESLLIEKGLVDPAAMDAVVQTYEHKVGPRNGAKVVAKAWMDPAYKARLLANGSAGIAELGYSGVQGEDTVILENTPAVHNVFVCTLCSCYPWPTLGLPPAWYKAAPYRSRMVSDPRGVLAEFGLEIPANKEIRVWDTTAELRYMVLPERPAGTEGYSEEQLAELVTRDSMIGTGLPTHPISLRSCHERHSRYWRSTWIWSGLQGAERTCLSPRLGKKGYGHVPGAVRKRTLQRR